MCLRKTLRVIVDYRTIVATLNHSGSGMNKYIGESVNE